MISFADLHCDTLYKCYTDGVELDAEDIHINVQQMRNFSRYIQVFAHYIPEMIDNKWEYFLSFLKNSREILLKYKVPIFQHAEDLDLPLLAVLSVEGGDFFRNEADLSERIAHLREWGILFFSMLYNGQNALGCGCAVQRDSGLTPLGKEAVSVLEQNRIIIDVSHASYQSTEDILSYSHRPVCATHSNAWALMSHRRNLHDQHLRAIAESGGLVGVNLYPPFLSQQSADVLDICRHIDYLMDMCGENAVCFGCDFDGVDQLPTGVEKLSSLEKLYYEMGRLGYKESILDKLFFDNLFVFLKENFRR